MLINAFLEEAKWFRSGHVPKTEEYLKNGIVSTGVHMILVHAFFFIGEGITEETVAVMEGLPTLISTTATILRLCDDLEGDQVGRKPSFSYVTIHLLLNYYLGVDHK